MARINPGKRELVYSNKCSNCGRSYYLEDAETPGVCPECIDEADYFTGALPNKEWEKQQRKRRENK
jgi:rubrerythrin